MAAGSESAVHNDVALMNGVWRTQIQRHAEDLAGATPLEVGASLAATLPPVNFTAEMLSNETEFSPGYSTEWTSSRVAAWKAYLLRYARGSQGRLCTKAFYSGGRCLMTAPIIKQPEWSALIREGVPDELRAQIWFHGSRANLLRAANAGLYARLVAESATREFAAARDIGKDIDRTMPSHPFYQTPEGWRACSACWPVTPCTIQRLDTRSR